MKLSMGREIKTGLRYAHEYVLYVTYMLGDADHYIKEEYSSTSQEQVVRWLDLIRQTQELTRTGGYRGAEEATRIITQWEDSASDSDYALVRTWPYDHDHRAPVTSAEVRWHDGEGAIYAIIEKEEE